MVAAALAGRTAIVTPAESGCVVVFDKESDEQNQEIIAELASRLSGTLQCPLLAVLNHDDDILWYQLYLNGGLVDEYNSAPGYFETEDEEAAGAGPEGGDAGKLCRAFGSNATAEVERILRKPSAEDDGYVFAVERHGDLAAALGIPAFGVGAGFETIAGGELPEAVDGRDLMDAKELAAGPSLEDIWCRPVPGYYKTSFRAHPGLTKSIPSCWMPGLWADLECAERELSEQFRMATAEARKKFQQLGFAEVGFKKLKRVLNPHSRDRGGINYLDGSRRHFGQIIYNRTFIPSLQAERETLVVSFTAVFADGAFSCTNNPETFEPVPNHSVVRFKSGDVAFIYGQFVERLNQRSDAPREFADLA